MDQAAQIQHPQGPASDKLRPVVGSLFFLAGLFCLNFTCRVAAGPLMPAMEAELGFRHAAAGSMFLAVSLGYVIAILGSGFITARLSHRNLIGLANMGLGVALMSVGLADSGLTLWLTLFGVGLTGGLYFPSAVATITTLLRPGLWARGIAIHELAPVTSLIITPLAAEGLMQLAGWRTAVFLIGALTLAWATAYLLLGRGGRFTGNAPDLAALKRLFSKRSTWLMSLILGILVGSSQGSFNMLPLYLMDVADLNRAEANLLLSLSRGGPPLALLVAGWLADKFGPLKMTLIPMALGGVFTLALGLTKGSLLITALFLQPAVLSFCFAAVFTLIASSADDRDRSLVVSLTTAAGILFGVGLVPLGLGWLGDHDLFPQAMVVLGCLLIGGAGLGRLIGRPEAANG